MFRLYKEINPAAVERRSSKIKNHRGSYQVPGPNYVWSIDGHCKLDFFGFEVYAGIDAYSRYVPWTYVGVSAKTKLSVLAQFLQVLLCVGFQPVVLRSDRGTETTLVADAFHTLSKGHALRSIDLKFEECFWYGTSTANQRIEAWWNQLTKGQLQIWRVCYKFYAL